MIKFSTKTNYFLVSKVMLITLPILKVFGIDTHNVQVRRNQLNWKLNLTEVIDFMIFLLGGFDSKGSSAFISKIKPDDTIIDIGANLGSFCLVVAKNLNSSGQIIAVEPSNYSYNKLKENINLNPEEKAKIKGLQAFITSKSQDFPTSVHSSWDIKSDEQRHSNHLGILKSTSNAIGLRLDDLLTYMEIKTLNWLKIDVDGFEKDVLFGGEETFKIHKPNIFIELCEYSLKEQNSSVTEILEFLQQFGYQFESENGKKFDSIHDILLTIPNMGTINIFAILPNDKR